MPYGWRGKAVTIQPDFGPQGEMPLNHQIVLKDAVKGYTLDQDKLMSPEETVRRFRERLQIVDLDILKETVRIDKGRLGNQVYLSV